MFGDAPFTIGEDGYTRYYGRVWLPNDDQIKNEVLTKLNNSRFMINLGCIEMYHEVKQTFLWSRMKNDITEYIVRCLFC